MGPLSADPRVELVRRVLGEVPMRPAQHDLDKAAAAIVAALDNAHNHDQRFAIGWDDETGD